MKKSLLNPNQPTSSSTSLSLLLFTFTLLLQLLSAQSSSAHSLPPQPPPPPSRQVTPLAGLTMEEKTRLGSMPPSCYNKCNGCHPCMAVQVPSGPVTHRATAIKNHDADMVAVKFLEPSPLEEGRYSNYKPLGWKCRCRNHFYNP